MGSSLRPVFAGLLLSALAIVAKPALADVFSSQGFSGETATVDQLPGVNFDVIPGNSSSASNCAEEDTMAFATGRGGNLPQRATTCRFGNFSITSTGSNSASGFYDTTYGGNRPPWVPNWRP